MKIGELFSGYGGLGMGVQSVYGGTIAWHSDIDKGACKILAHRYPDVPNLGDITTVDWSQVEPVDILTGGSPCQDLSHAGRRAGMTEGTRSNLWVAMREAIAQLRPARVIWENVRGAASAEATSSLEFCPGCMGDPQHRGPSLRALGRVVGDLSDLGYVGRVRGLRAADVGAPHGRFRYFLDAADANGGQHVPSGARSDQRPVPHGDEGGSPAALLPTPSCSDTNGAGSHGDGGLDLRTAVSLMPTPRATDGTKGGPNQRGSSGDLMLPSAVAMLPTPTTRDHKGHNQRRDESCLTGALLPTPTVQHSARNSTAGRSPNAKPHAEGDTLADLVFDGRLLPTPSVADVMGGRKARSGERNDEPLLNGIAAANLWGDYVTAIARWESVLGRPAPAPTMTSAKGNPQLSPVFVEWLMGLPAGWVTDVPGITRNEALKALGNGVVPQQAAAALRVMASWEVAA